MRSTITVTRIMCFTFMIGVCSLMYSYMVRADLVTVSVNVATNLQMTVDSPSLSIGPLIPGQAETAMTEVTVSTNSEHGYQLSAHHSSDGYVHTMRHTDEVTYILDKDDFDGTADTTAVWTGAGLGFTVFVATEKDAAVWGTGTTVNDSNNRYTGFPDSSTVINAVQTNVTNDITKVGYKANVSSAQKAGTYAGNVTFTATVIP